MMLKFKLHENLLLLKGVNIIFLSLLNDYVDRVESLVSLSLSLSKAFFLKTLEYNSLAMSY